MFMVGNFDPCRPAPLCFSRMQVPCRADRAAPRDSLAKPYGFTFFRCVAFEAFVGRNVSSTRGLGNMARQGKPAQ